MIKVFILLENKYWHEKDDFDSNDDEDFCLNDGSKFGKFENLFEGIDKFKVDQYKNISKTKILEFTQRNNGFLRINHI